MSGHAFRINIHPADVNAAGPTMFDPEHLLEHGLHLLGFGTEPLHGFPTPATPEQLREAIEFAQASIDRGLPIIGWSLFIPEFGLIYGYDDEKQELSCPDPCQDGALPYAKLNELPLKFVYMLRVTDSYDVDPLQAWTKGLKSIIEFARGQAPTMSAEYKHGLAGYDAWIEAFRHRTVDPSAMRTTRRSSAAPASSGFASWNHSRNDGRGISSGRKRSAGWAPKRRSITEPWRRRSAGCTGCSPSRMAESLTSRQTRARR
ncbi:hypothetical protein WDD9_003131 [Paenibacillus melissococcoides]|uniref:hypothetical protein n=1 Tax=Paenibacillus TaxID=44249 RepID=UPI001BCC2248|nr:MULTISPECIES: hypothetical protein [Paenibacillus]MEB9892202.1 hypothetical protein [Bacillus cereus]CAH8712147.1 hypothetical protein WDD9_003131 [Paenibacillus melissococcoides]